MTAPRPRPARLSDALGVKLEPRMRAFADALAAAITAKILREIRAGKWVNMAAKSQREDEGER